PTDMLEVPDPSAAGPVTGSGPVDFEPELVGRREELETLLGHTRDAVAGGGVVVCLTGQPGMGKSRLLQATASAAGEAGMTVLRGSAFDQTARRPLGLFRAALDDLAGFLRAHPAQASLVADELGGALPSVGTLVPGIAAVLGGELSEAGLPLTGVAAAEGVPGSA